MVSSLVEIAIDGLARGFILAMLGAGITLVFGLGGILNIAIGAFSVMAVIVAVWSTSYVVHPFAGAIVGILSVAILCLIVDRTMLSSVYRSEGEERIVTGIFTTLGLEILLAGSLAILFSGTFSVDYDSTLVEFGGIAVRSSSFVIIGISAVILAGLFGFLRYTFLGKATRTVFQDETGSLLVGINPRTIRTMIFVLSGMLASVGGILWSIQAPVASGDAFTFTVFAIIVSIVGGVRNIEGTIAAGILLGLVWTFANYQLGGVYGMLLLFLAAVSVLILRPEEIS